MFTRLACQSIVSRDDGLMLPRWLEIKNTADRQWRSKMAATLKVTHKAIGVEVRRGTYDIVVDGQPAGSLEMNDSIEIPVERGRHTLQVRSGRKSSRTQTFEAPRARPSPSGAPERAFCRASSRLSSSPAWRSSFAREADDRFLVTTAMSAAIHVLARLRALLPGTAELGPAVRPGRVMASPAHCAGVLSAGRWGPARQFD